jgi:hypothetical protein
VPLAVGVLVVLVALVLGAALRDDQHAQLDCSEYRFPSAAWKKHPNNRDNAELNARRQAVDAIVECGVLEGLTKREARWTLGRPHQSDSNAWIYVVGHERGPVVVDSEHLQINFRNDRVSTAELFDG